MKQKGAERGGGVVCEWEDARGRGANHYTRDALMSFHSRSPS